MAMTPADTPSSPSNYAAVTPHGRGTAAYDVQADQADLSGEFNAANALTGAGVLYPMSERQADTERLLSSPQGYGAFDITTGWHGSDGDVWPGDPRP